VKTHPEFRPCPPNDPARAQPVHAGEAGEGQDHGIGYVRRRNSRARLARQTIPNGTLPRMGPRGLSHRPASAVELAASSFAALAIILTEKGIPDPFPIQHGIGRVAQALDGDGQVVEILQVPLDGERDDLGARAAQRAGGRVERSDDLIGQPSGDLRLVSRWAARMSTGSPWLRRAVPAMGRAVARIAPRAALTRRVRTAHREEGCVVRTLQATGSVAAAPWPRWGSRRGRISHRGPRSSPPGRGGPSACRPSSR